MAAVKQQAPTGMPSAEVLLRDQFAEHVIDGALRRELKRFVRGQPNSTLLDVRAEAMRWEQEGSPGGMRGRNKSVPPGPGFQYEVQCTPAPANSHLTSQLNEMKEMMKLQQDQINKLSQSFLSLQNSHKGSRSVNRSAIVCRRCQQLGHFARECDGVRVSQTQPVQSSQQPQRQSNIPQSGNWLPPSC